MVIFAPVSALISFSFFPGVTVATLWFLFHFIFSLLIENVLMCWVLFTSLKKHQFKVVCTVDLSFEHPADDL